MPVQKMQSSKDSDRIVTDKLQKFKD